MTDAPAAPPRLQFLQFDASDDADGVTSVEAMAATRADRHAAVLAEAQQVLDWLGSRFALGPGPLDEGHDWHHDLQVTTEGDGWQVVTLTLALSARCAEAFLGAFGTAFGDPADPD